MIDDNWTVELSQKLIRLDTVDPPGNEEAAARVVAQALAEYGIDAELQSIGPGRSNLVARVKGSGEADALIYSAHFDTIPVNADEWSVDPFGGEVKDGRLYGRGSTDMKAAMAAMVAAAIQLKESGQPLKGDLVLAFTAAENTDCRGAHLLVESGILEGAGALLISEPTSLKVFVTEKGALWLRASATGVYGHNAFSEDRDGDRGNAIIRMAEFLTRVRDLELDAPVHRHLGPPTINVGLIEGGISRPLIPPSCSASIDIRTVPGLTNDAIIKAFEAIAGEYVTIEYVDFKPVVDTADDHPFVELCMASCESVFGSAPELTGVPYYTDGAIIAPALHIPMVILGPGDVGKSGSIDEYVDLDKLALAQQAYVEIARRALL
ncbi:putative succinyl-diaminopimelate desuccinylase [Tsuneonella dongtanensis]|uniref:Putative succinyl-diaminopimelate desuccinylase n=1 Tax=Tsuneonella dongtanensis TaxID=692370 RepID=A0A1B2A920_9SPHN|nr:M20 family metallopeptidase [Tsuneonella dongtanensis]ANY18632.1 putative succinyl-diaminopimelate desuccinylase [Tsuneonella dongtanensis]